MKSNKKIQNVSIADTESKVEFDTGASVTMIAMTTIKLLWHMNPPYMCTYTKRLRTYTLQCILVNVLFVLSYYTLHLVIIINILTSPLLLPSKTSIYSS